MVSYHHSAFDDRIYWKECLSLKKAGYEVSHVASGVQDRIFVSKEGIALIEVCKGGKRTVWNKLRSPFYNYILLQRIYHAAEQQGADVYHLHDWPLALLASDLKRLPNKPKVIFDVHDNNQADMLARRAFKGFGKKIYFKLLADYIFDKERKFYAACDAMIFAEEKVRDKFSTILKDIPCYCVHNYSYFSPVEPVADRHYEYDLIYSGTVNLNRGMVELIKAVEIVKRDRPLIKALIIGFASEELFSFLQRLILSLGLAENIEMKRSVPFAEIQDYYLKSRIGVCVLHPTPKFLEAIPIKIFEYMAFGLPVIISNKGIATKYIVEPNAGLTVEPLSLEDIASAIHQLLDNPKEAELLGSNGRNAIRDKYNWSREEKILLKLYKTL
ncbi:MAG: glycosyltransferase family 4 protein [Niabella sp.]